jgi:ATP-dependent protease HslVU (ClpYQ) ATPase subunit
VGKIATSPLPDEIRDIVLDAVNNKKKVLFLGQTGVGKTTLIRQISKFLSDQGIGASIFDKSKEIGGPGLTPNPEAIGFRARRFVPKPLQDIAEALIRMLENHNPKVLMVDELSNRNQFEAVARMIKEKGIATAFIFTHGTTLGKAMHSKNTKELLTEVETVTVGDDIAQKTRNGDVEDKTRHNVVGRPLAHVVVEMVAPGVYAVHRDVEDSMKKLAAGKEPTVEFYPRGTKIREYRSEEAEQFIARKEMPDPLERGTNQAKPFLAVVNHEFEFKEERTQEPQRKSSHVSKTDIKSMSDQRLKKLHDEIARIPEANRSAKQGTLFPRLAEEIQRRSN